MATAKDAPCPVCRDPAREVECMICHTYYHRDCWNEVTHCSVYACPSEHSSDQIEDYQKLYRTAIGYRRTQRVVGRSQVLVPISACIFGMLYVIVLTMCLIGTNLNPPEKRHESSRIYDEDDDVKVSPSLQIVQFMDYSVVIASPTGYYIRSYNQLDSVEWAAVMEAHPPGHVMNKFFAKWNL